MAKALYRQYRPKTFDEVLGQDRVVNVLKNQVKNNNFSHAYIFAGERGCGKTTCAKIFAKAINCLHPKDGSPCLECENCKAIDDESTIDIIEMDAASNRRIDDIRNLKDNVIYPPNKLKYKVYIIDEAHMITREAFNALLKIMEEPPSHLVFILATTEIDKIPNTILSRVQNFEFNKIDSSKIKEQINIILDDKDIKMENEAIDLIIRKANGAMRDALSILDQVISYDSKDFKISDVEELLGVVDFYDIDKLTSSIFSFNQKEALSYIFSLRENNKSNKDILDSLTYYLRDIMVYKMTEDESNFENKERLDFIKKSSENIDIERLLDMLDILSEYSNKLRYSENTDLIIELLAVRLINTKDISSLDSRIRNLEMRNADDLVSLVNDLVSDKLKNLDKIDLSLQGNSTSSNLVNVGNEDDTQIMSTKETIIEPEVMESKEESEKIDQDNIDDHKKNPDTINLPENMIEDIKNVIIDIAGRMLKPMFDSDGFYYTYKPGEFVLYLKDDFYGIFVQTKTEEIGKSLGEIFSREISFSLGDYKDLEKSSQKKTSKLESESQTSTEVENIEDTLDVEEKSVSINSSDEDIVDESKNIIKNDGDTSNIEKNAEIHKLKEIFGEELIIK
ncbi:DNA polymerase III subunit gamma/tau [Anaerococcus prevotii]|uniref:DNA polymerase III subunit delta' n=1 Tax=Anaerococcus prevotii ACS-065-V-Col13 TaxID=879305 RepID=F0GUR7_9FIRM|nr:DNA polymerase III subunit gamma/tau [Anaerococcus prevotii]EGC82469.1 DNA polymerase III, subunit gamma and tau [Anaerococcus prevotii ACS-065-V-Col13]